MRSIRLFLTAFLLFANATLTTLLLVCLVSNMASAQILARPEADNQDPVACFDHVLRDARNAVQAYQIVYAPGWKDETGCHGKVPAPDLEPCWPPVLKARPLIEQAAKLYEQARRTPAPQQGQLVAQGNALVRQAAGLLDQAGKCFQPVFARWQQNGGRYVAGGYSGNANAGTGGDTFSSNSGVGGLPGEPRIDQYGRDPECGGTDRRYYDAMYGTKAVVMSVQAMNQLYAQGRIIRCGACRQNVICWLNPDSSTASAPPSAPQGSSSTPPPTPACTTPVECKCMQVGDLPFPRSRVLLAQAGDIHSLKGGLRLAQAVPTFPLIGVFPPGLEGFFLKRLLGSPGPGTFFGPLCDSYLLTGGAQRMLEWLVAQYQNTEARIQYLQGRGVHRSGAENSQLAALVNQEHRLRVAIRVLHGAYDAALKRNPLAHPGVDLNFPF